MILLQDYTGNDRKKEEQYMVRTDEAIYQRASEEHIKRPPLWHDDEVDSLRVSQFTNLISLYLFISASTSQAADSN